MKAIAIVDMPDDVFNIYEELTIRGNISLDGEHLLVMTLKPLPEKKEEYKDWKHSSRWRADELYSVGQEDGWNACLEQITGETE